MNYLRPERLSGGLSTLYRGVGLEFFSRISCFRPMDLSSTKGDSADDLVRLKVAVTYREIMREASYFEACRSAIFFVSSYLAKEKGVRRALVCSFTCDAVIKPLRAVGLEIVWVDVNPQTLKMDEQQILQAVAQEDTLVVLQNTFGMPAANEGLVRTLKSMGVWVLVDNSLAHGSGPCLPLLRLADFHVFSLEVSKAFTVGWGGGLIVNSPDIRRDIAEAYAGLRPVPALQDLRRVLQFYLMCRLQRVGRGLLFLVWLFLRASGVIQRSGPKKFTATGRARRLGPVSHWLVRRLTETYFCDFWRRANKKSEDAVKRLEQTGACLPSVFRQPTLCGLVTPRVPVYLSSHQRSMFQERLSRNRVSITTWFEKPFPDSRVNDVIPPSSQAEWMASTVVNVPCYLGMTDDEIALVIGQLASTHQPPTLNA